MDQVGRDSLGVSLLIMIKFAMCSLLLLEWGEKRLASFAQRPIEEEIVQDHEELKNFYKQFKSTGNILVVLLLIARTLVFLVSFKSVFKSRSFLHRWHEVVQSGLAIPPILRFGADCPPHSVLVFSQESYVGVLGFGVKPFSSFRSSFGSCVGIPWAKSLLCTLFLTNWVRWSFSWPRSPLCVCLSLLRLSRSFSLSLSLFLTLTHTHLSLINL